MLKVRISGSQHEIKQLSAQLCLGGEIRSFKNKQGKKTYALDVEMNLVDLQQALSTKSIDKSNSCDPHLIKTELQDVLEKLR